MGVDSDRLIMGLGDLYFKSILDLFGLAYKELI